MAQDLERTELFAVTVSRDSFSEAEQMRDTFSGGIDERELGDANGNDTAVLHGVSIEENVPVRIFTEPVELSAQALPEGSSTIGQLGLTEVPVTKRNPRRKTVAEMKASGGTSPTLARLARNRGISVREMLLEVRGSYPNRATAAAALGISASLLDYGLSLEEIPSFTREEALAHFSDIRGEASSVEERRERELAVFLEPFGPDGKVRLQEMVGNGMSWDAIGREVGRDGLTVQRYAASLGITRPDDVKTIVHYSPRPNISRQGLVDAFRATSYYGELPDRYRIYLDKRFPEDGDSVPQRELGPSASSANGKERRIEKAIHTILDRHFLTAEDVLAAYQKAQAEKQKQANSEE